jgi:hypothetical protein
MLASTILAVLFVPVFYLLVQQFSEWISPPRPPAADEPAPSLTHGEANHVRDGHAITSTPAAPISKPSASH